MRERALEREALLLGVPWMASLRSLVGLGERLLGVPVGSMSKIPRTWPSRWGVGPRALRMNAGVGCDSFTGERIGCWSTVSTGFGSLLLGVVAAALGARSRKALSGMFLVLEAFFGVSIARLAVLFSGFRSELNNLYLAAIDALLLMSSREGLRPPLSVLNCFSHALSSSRSVIVSVAMIWRFFVKGFGVMVGHSQQETRRDVACVKVL